MIARTFMRLAALEALRPSALIVPDGPWPTIAGRYVFDSRFDPVDDLAADERRPVCAVSTDAHALDKISQSGPVLYKGMVDLVIDVSVVAQDGAAEDAIVYVSLTDAELDAQLDLFEEQIFWALHFGSTGQLFRKLAKLPLIDWHSLPHRTSEEGYRLAMRTIRAKVALRETCYNAAPAAPLAGYDRLPPALKDVATALAASGSTYLADLTAALAAAQPTAVPAPPLESVGLHVDLHAPQTDVDPAAGADVAASADNLQG